MSGSLHSDCANPYTPFFFQCETLHRPGVQVKGARCGVHLQGNCPGRQHEQRRAKHAPQSDAVLSVRIQEDIREALGWSQHACQAGTVEGRREQRIGHPLACLDVAQNIQVPHCTLCTGQQYLQVGIPKAKRP